MFISFLPLGRKAMTNLDSILKNKDITLPTKFCLVKAMFFSSSHVWVWELDLKEGWASKNWCFVTMVLEKTLESPLDCKEIKPVNPKGNQSWIFIGRPDAWTETPILWPPDAKSWLIRKDPDAEKDWRQEERGMTEDKKVGWHHWLNGHEFEQTLGDGEGQRSVACYSPWGHKEWTRLSNWATTSFLPLLSILSIRNSVSTIFLSPNCNISASFVWLIFILIMYDILFFPCLVNFY